MEFDCYYFWIEFNVDYGSYLDVRVIDGNKAYDTKLSSLYVGYNWDTGEYTPLQGFDPDIYEYYVLVREGTSPHDPITWNYGEATEEYAEISYSYLEVIPGSITLTIITWDLKPTKTYTVHFVTSPDQLPAFITAHRISQTVTVGQTVTFAVEATGAEPMSYKWMKDGAELSDDENINGSDTADLTIISARESDSGSYTVTVTNELASVTSKTAVLTVRALPVMSGSVAIQGTAKYGETLTADISGITYTPDISDDIPTYQWKRNGVDIPGATASSYTLVQADIGTLITVTVTADGVHATGSVTSSPTATVDKANGPAAPGAPTLVSKTHNSVTLEASLAYEYRVNGGAWQDSNVFTGLSAETEYTFAVRIKETATHKSSAESAGLTVKTDNVPPTLVTSITVRSINDAAAVVKGGNLQMIADVLPADATDKTVTWSVNPGTGTATIDPSTGLLMGTGEGTVTVRAAANDGSGVFGEMVITVTPEPAITFTVTFDSQGGSSVESLTGVMPGSTITKPSTPERPGYTFGGWYKEAACINPWNFSVDTVTENITLYAKWIYNSAGSGGGIGGGIIIGGSDSDDTQDTQTYNAIISCINKTEISLSLYVNEDTGNATAELENSMINDIFDGTGTPVLTVPSIPDVNSYT